MRAVPEKTMHQNDEAPLQLVLFVDRRPRSSEQIRRIRSYFQKRRTGIPFDLEIIDVSEQPYLAEQFKLVATPALIKLHPGPRQVLAGSNLVGELDKWWDRWQKSVEEYLNKQASEEAIGHYPRKSISSELAHSAELMELSDEIFRLKQEKEELLDQLHFKDRLIAMLAHELRNPLTAASLALETLEITYKPEKSLNPEAASALRARLIYHARTQTRLIDRMISDILVAAHSTNSADFHIHPQKLNLKTLTLNILENFKDHLLAKSHTLKTDIPNDLPSVYADGERVRQVIVNLLDNAIKYTPQGGQIEVCILHRTTQKVQVSVIDTGPGIPAENQEHIFEDKFRLQRDEQKDGYGIGLSLCKRLIRANCGEIWVDSSCNKGSAFHFTLPVYRQ